ncbi:MAG: S8 family serine peptidase [Clostridia bacterium]
MGANWQRSICIALAVIVGSSEAPSILYAANADYQTNQRHISLRQEKPAYIEKGLDTRSDKEVRVIVQLQASPYVPLASSTSEKEGLTTLSAAKKTIRRQQIELEQTASKEGLDLDVDRRFDTLLNAVELTLPADQIPRLANMPNVRAIHANKVVEIKADPKVEIPPFTADPMAAHKRIGALDAWQDGYTGKRVKVGIIDTGIDYLHPDLKKAYKGGYDFIDNDKDPYEELSLENLEISNHGTMVAGVIAGRAENKETPSPVKGIAYDSNVYMYRISSARDDLLAYTTADLIAAVEKAANDHMDVINISLGAIGIEMTDSLSPEAVAINNAMLQGVTVVVSAGNDTTPDDYYYRVNSPGNALFPITVGLSSIETKQLRITSKTSLGTTHTLLVNHWFGTDFNFEQPLPIVYANLGKASDFADTDAAGKIAVISRGEIPFKEKLGNATNAGALGVILFDGIDSDHDGRADLELSDYRDYIENEYLTEVYNYNPFEIPLLLMRGEEGRRLAKGLLALSKDTPATLQMTDSEMRVLNEGDRIYHFSSRGPVTTDYLIKPDVVAPAQPLLSTLSADGKIPGADVDYAYDYRYGGGTSAAAPVVTASVTLIKQAHPDWTPFDIKAALANTAEPLEDGEGTRFDVYSQGAGSINVAKALQTPAILQTVEKVTNLNNQMLPVPVTYYGDNVSFGLVAPEARTVTKQLQLKNTSKQTVTYNAKVVMHDNVTSDPTYPVETPDVNDLDVSLSKKTIRVSKQSTSRFTLKLTVPRQAKEGVYEGEVVLQSNKQGHPDLHLPFVVHVGDKPVQTPAGFSEVHFSSRVLSPDGDGEDDTLRIDAHLDTDEANVVLVEAIDEKNGYDFVLDAYFDRDEDGNPTFAMLPSGPITFAQVDGTYLADIFQSPERKPIPNGMYRVSLHSLRLDPSTMKVDLIGEYYQYVTVINSDPLPPKDALKKQVTEAAQSFEPIAVNTKVIGERVLYMPVEPENLDFTVVHSSDQTYIRSNGILRALPEQKQTVTLKVKISSPLDKRIYAYAMYNVVLEPE